MDRSRQVIGVVLILISIILMVGWEKWGRQTFLTSEILVLNRNVPKGEIVKEEDLRILRVEGARKEWLRPEDRGQIQGLEASGNLHKGVPLFSDDVEEEGLTADAELDRFVVNLPESWLAAYPFGIRKGDRAYLYLSGKFLLDAPVRQADGENRNLSLVTDGKSAGIISGLGAEGKQFVVTYHE